MLEKGIRYPLEGDALRRYAIATVLFVGTLLILPIFILSGYMIRAGRDVALGEDQPPEFGNWVELFVLGLKGAVVSIAYGIIPIMLIVGSVVVVFGLGDSSGVAIGVSLVLAALGVVLYLGLIYVLPAALVAVDVEDRLGAATDLSVLVPVLSSVDYLVAIGLVILLNIASAVAVNLIAWTVVGLVLVPAISFYGSLAGYYFVGRAYGKVHSVSNTSETDNV
jgi:hypothetical protein